MQKWAEQTLNKALVKYKKGAQMAARQQIIPYKGGKPEWEGPPFDGDGWWTNGFWPGLMWQLYSAERDELFLNEARRVQALLVSELRAHERMNHDVGFQFLLSIGADACCTGTDAQVELLMAADVLAGRYNPNGFIRAWNGPGKQGWAIVDCLMNLPLLHWASEVTGDPRYRLIAAHHLDTAIKYFMREDGSCNHIVIFDAENGAVLETPGGQGYAPGSSWSRGQAWALYGFALAYFNTGEARYLEASRKVADFYLRHIREDGLTDCDFAQPETPELIDNIAGATAASGLLLLHKLTGEASYQDAAIRMLRALDELCADWSEDTCGILTRCTAAYFDDGAGREVNLMYGDYFFIEALNRLLGRDPLFWRAKGDVKCS